MQLVIIFYVCIHICLSEGNAPLVHVLPRRAVPRVHRVCVGLELGPGEDHLLDVEWRRGVEGLDVGCCFGGGAVVVCLHGYEGLL